MEKILFICEGSTEIFLLYKILEKEFNIKILENLKENGNLSMKNIKDIMTDFASTDNLSIEITDLKGERNLVNYTKVLSNNRFFLDLTKIIYIMDADYISGSETGYERTKKAIEDSIKELKEKSEDLEFDYFITPNNKDDGMTETLLLDSLNCQEVVDYIRNDVISVVKEMKNCEIKNEQKSTFMMVAATQNPLRGTAPAFISKCYDKFDKNSVSLKNLIDFLNKHIVN